MKMLKNQKGFTLIELVLVVVVLGILAAVASVQFGNLVKDSNKAAVDGAFGSYGAQLALGINTLKALPTVNDAAACPGTAGSFKAEVFCKTTISGGSLVAGGYTPGAAADTFTLTQGACVGTVTYTLLTGALTKVNGAGC